MAFGLRAAWERCGNELRMTPRLSLPLGALEPNSHFMVSHEWHNTNQPPVALASRPPGWSNQRPGRQTWQ